MIAKSPDIRVSLFVFVALICAANLLLFQKPLWGFALSVSDWPGTQGVIQMATLQVLQFCLLFALLYAVSLLSAPVVKIVCSALFVTNAVALFFMLHDGVELDRSTIGSILNREAGTAGELFSFAILPYVIGLGVLPSLLIWWVRIDMPLWYRRIAGALVSLVILVAWLVTMSFTWLWFDKHSTRMGAKILPWSYLINTARYYYRLSRDERAEERVLPAHVPSPRGDTQAVTTVTRAAARADF